MLFLFIINIYLRNLSSLFCCCCLVTHVRLFAIPWTAACQLPCISPSPRSPKLMSVESVMPSNHLVLYCALIFMPSISPRIRVISNESALLIRWPQYQSFSFKNSPSNEYSGLISFRIDWFDLLPVQETLKSFLQRQSSKHQFFTAQLSL